MRLTLRDLFLAFVALIVWAILAALGWGLTVGAWEVATDWGWSAELGFAAISAATFLIGVLAFLAAGALGRFVGARGGHSLLAIWPLILLALGDLYNGLNAPPNTPFLSRLYGPIIWLALIYTSWYFTDRARRLRSP